MEVEVKVESAHLRVVREGEDVEQIAQLVVIQWRLQSCASGRLLSRREASREKAGRTTCWLSAWNTQRGHAKESESADCATAAAGEDWPTLTGLLMQLGDASGEC